MNRSLALKVNDLDNVATIFANDAKAGTDVEIQDGQGKRVVITLNDDIPYGHKVAVASIQIGERVIKYGEEIGQATGNIQIGDHVHIHNLDSMRGRGDLR